MPQTLAEMGALSSALLPLLSSDGGDAHVSALTQQRQAGPGGLEGVMTASGDGAGLGDVERLLAAVLWKVRVGRVFAWGICYWRRRK